MHAAMPQTFSRIREATRDDITALMDIEERSFSSDRLSRRSFRHLLTEGNSVTLVDQMGDAVRGYITLLFRDDVSLARIYSIATAPEFLGKASLQACWTRPNNARW